MMKIRKFARSVEAGRNCPPHRKRRSADNTQITHGACGGVSELSSPPAEEGLLLFLPPRALATHGALH